MTLLDTLPCPTCCSENTACIRRQDNTETWSCPDCGSEWHELFCVDCGQPGPELDQHDRCVGCADAADTEDEEG